jgi:cell division protein FtsL
MNRRVKRSKPKPRVTATWIAVMVFFIVELFFYTWCRVQCTHLGYELAGARAEYRRGEALQKNLQVEYSRLRMPQRIERIARNRLGLTTPKAKQMIVVR